MRCFLNDNTVAALMRQHAHVFLLSIAVVVVANLLVYLFEFDINRIGRMKTTAAAVVARTTANWQRQSCTNSLVYFM